MVDNNNGDVKLSNIIVTTINQTKSVRTVIDYNKDQNLTSAHHSSLPSHHSLSIVTPIASIAPMVHDIQNPSPRVISIVSPQKDEVVLGIGAVASAAAVVPSSSPRPPINNNNNDGHNNLAVADVGKDLPLVIHSQPPIQLAVAGAPVPPADLPASPLTPVLVPVNAEVAASPQPPPTPRPLLERCHAEGCSNCSLFMPPSLITDEQHALQVGALCDRCHHSAMSHSSKQLQQLVRIHFISFIGRPWIAIFGHCCLSRTLFTTFILILSSNLSCQTINRKVFLMQCPNRHH
jgi:hypothetical protein